MQTRVWNACIVTQYQAKRRSHLNRLTTVWKACIVTPYQGKRKSRLNRRRHACETHALWRYTKENAEVVFTDADTRVNLHSLWPHTKENGKAVLTNAETRVKHMLCWLDFTFWQQSEIKKMGDFRQFFYTQVRNIYIDML